MAQKRKPIIPETVSRILKTVVGSILTVIVLAFSVLTIQYVLKKDYAKASEFLVWVFLFLGLTKLFSFFKSRQKEDLIRGIVLLVLNIGSGVLSYFGKNNPYIFSIAAGIYAVSIVASRGIKLIKHHTIRDIVLNTLIIVFAALLAFVFFSSSDLDVIDSIIIIECFIIAFSAFIEVATTSLAQLKFKVLFKIILKTFAFEVLFGLLIVMVTFSIILPSYESSLANFGDALWYCFAVVTTIGFGDFAATTLVGRILTVILGIYGIIVVAIITSIIVNFYNETTGKQDSKELQDIKKETEEELKNKK